MTAKAFARLLMLLALLFIPRAADATPIVVTMEGGWTFYNPDAHSLCRDGTAPELCPFFDLMASYGVVVSDTPSAMEMVLTLLNVHDDASGNQVWLTDVQMRIGETLVIDSAPVPLTYYDYPDPSHVVPGGTETILSGQMRGPAGGQFTPNNLQFNFDSLAPADDLVARLLDPSTKIYYYTNLTSGDVDGSGALTVTSVRQVPEANTLLLTLPMVGWAAKRARQSQP